MNDNQVVSFRDENGKKIEYLVLKQKLICGAEYVAMAPKNDKTHVELFKINFDKDWNETLDSVESEKEINMFKQVSNLKF
ncbi:DUF1292 domain-containing protein [Clostridium perfringens]|uniref:DUF1292 domain-containing protein n=1 Tax=Clostridium perfringens TaxID=1502 RepID=UPI003D34BB8E